MTTTPLTAELSTALDDLRAAGHGELADSYLDLRRRLETVEAVIIEVLGYLIDELDPDPDDWSSYATSDDGKKLLDELEGRHLEAERAKHAQRRAQADAAAANRRKDAGQ